MINTAVYSYSSQEFADDLESVISLMEGVAAVGVTVGPVIGVYVNNAVGFSYTFFIFGLVQLPWMFLVGCIPKPHSVTLEDATSEEVSRSQL